jgi:uncharacterized membrane protein YobD (UPF0266 family)
MKTLVLKTVRHNFQVLALIVSTVCTSVARHAPYVAMLLATLAIVIAPIALIVASILLQAQGIAFAILWIAFFASCCSNVFLLDYFRKH